MHWEYFAWEKVITDCYLGCHAVPVLTTVDIPNNINAPTIKCDEAEGEKYSHPKPGIVQSASKLCNHGRLQTD